MMRVFKLLFALTACMVCALLAIPTAAVATEPTFNWQDFAVPADTQQIVAADLNGDGLQELIASGKSGLRVYVHGAEGFDFERGFYDIKPEARSLAWDVSESFSGAEGSQPADGSRPAEGSQTSLLLLLDGARLQRWRLPAGAATNTPLQADIIAEGLPGRLPGGINRLFMTQDINADGLDDLIIPGNSGLHLYLNEGSGRLAAPFPLRADFLVRTNLRSYFSGGSPNNTGGERIETRIGQAVRIPLMSLRDLNSDGQQDLISNTDDLLAVFLADSAGRFPASPSYELDIAAIQEGLGEFDIDKLDFSNLTGALALTHEQILEDTDNDGIADLLLREGSKVSLFAGTADGMDFEQPVQVLRSGGNVLGTFLYDEDGDGKKDLWLWRVEAVSVGDIFVWLALSGSVAIEAFIYPNEGRRFARRPTRRLSIDLRFPSMIRMATSFRAIAEEARQTTSSSITPSARGRITLPDTSASANSGGVSVDVRDRGANANDSDSTAKERTDGLPPRQDLLVLLGDRIEVFLDAIAPESAPEFLGNIGYSRQRDDYQIDIRDIINRINVGSDPSLQQVADRQPDIIWPLSPPTNGGDILLAPLNADSVDDILIITTATQTQIQGHLLLSE